MTESEFQEFIITIGYRYNEKSKSAFNTFEGFHAIIVFNEKEKRYSLSMSTASPNVADAADVTNQLKKFHSKHKNYVTRADYRQRAVNICLKMTVDSDLDKEELKEIARFIIQLCKCGKVSPICKVCCRERKTGLYVVGRELTPMCDPCVTRKRRQYEHRKNIFIKKKQNMPGGLAGAVFGALLGAGMYVLAYQLVPFCAILSGLILSLSYTGFVITGQRATKKSAVICTFLSAIVFAAAEYTAMVANMAILIEEQGGGIAVSEAIDSINDGLGNMLYTEQFINDLLIGAVVMLVVGIIYFLKRKYTRPLKISKNIL